MKKQSKLITTVGLTLALLTGCDASNAVDRAFEARDALNTHLTEVSDLATTEYGKVKNVVDGDTVDIQLNDNKETRVRMILINTPESKGDYKDNPQPYALEAAAFTEMILKDAKVRIEYDVEKTDRYDRTLAYLWLEDVKYKYDGVKYKEKEITINELLLRHGLAHVAVYMPNDKYKEHFYTVENEAKKNRVGIWKD